MLFTLDAAAESMEQESLDVGIAPMLEALDHVAGALHDVAGCFAIGTIEVPLPSFLSIESSLIEIGLGVLPRGHECAMCLLSRHE